MHGDLLLALLQILLHSRIDAIHNRDFHPVFAHLLCPNNNHFVLQNLRWVCQNPNQWVSKILYHTLNSKIAVHRVLLLGRNFHYKLIYTKISHQHQFLDTYPTHLKEGILSSQVELDGPQPDAFHLPLGKYQDYRHVQRDKVHHPHLLKVMLYSFQLT